MKFNDENKAVREFDNNYFDYGVHRVNILLFELGETDAGKEYIEVTIADMTDGDKTDTARVWFSTDAATNYSFNTLRQIYVHNAPEAKKDEAKATFDALGDTEEMTAELNSKLIGGECWYTKYVDPTRTYQASNGETRQSVNKSILGYEPKLNAALMPKTINGLIDTALANVQKVMPGAKEVPFESENDAPGSTVAANKTVPSNDAWSK